MCTNRLTQLINFFVIKYRPRLVWIGNNILYGYLTNFFVVCFLAQAKYTRK
ncbi:Uncharacterised protein [Mycobacterium tuberculosis]|nr:Uncharacterised protein [Mycobacterium tuberculosis]